VALRNATREKAYGFIPIMATPASGHEKEDHTFQFALSFTSSGNWAENKLPQQGRIYATEPWTADENSELHQRLRQEVQISSDQVWLEALKPAWRGEGLIARLQAYTPLPIEVKLGICGWEIGEAYECDARERNIRPVEVRDGQARLTLRQSITSLRLLRRG
jgi:alpha-mannosidase